MNPTSPLQRFKAHVERQRLRVKMGLKLHLLSSQYPLSTIFYFLMPLDHQDSNKMLPAVHQAHENRAKSVGLDMPVKLSAYTVCKRSVSQGEMYKNWKEKKKKKVEHMQQMQVVKHSSPEQCRHVWRVVGDICNNSRHLSD